MTDKWPINFQWCFLSVHSDQTSFQSSSLYLWALGKHCFVKMSSSTLCCTVFLYNVFALNYTSNFQYLRSVKLPWLNGTLTQWNSDSKMHSTQVKYKNHWHPGLTDTPDSKIPTLTKWYTWITVTLIFMIPSE